MIRISEMVLPGHPDKFCDQIADAVIAACVKADPEAYGQIEVAVWSDQVWLSGGTCTQQPIATPIEEIVRQVGVRVGYTDGNCIDAARYKVVSTVCLLQGDPARWSHKVNDQSVVIGWAGYDRRTRYLPPEHFLAHVFREALTASCRDGGLRGQGPDGKLMVRLVEGADRWSVEHVLVTLQQREDAAFMDVCRGVIQALQEAYERVQSQDGRWCNAFRDVELMINPNGPLTNGGSDGDNGQTGRKLVMDFYGPRIPIGGGALSGKHLTHIDRIGAYGARAAAVRAVASGARECLVRVAYAPNRREPLDVTYEMVGRGDRVGAKELSHDALRDRYATDLDYEGLGRGEHFFDPAMPWNGG